VSRREAAGTYAKLAARDLAIGAGAALLWALASRFSAGSGWVSDLSGLLVGLALGACTFLLHEWGHFAGALAGRSAVRPAESLRSPFVFSFDSRLNSRRQFLLMSFGGFAATGAAVWLSQTLLPADLLATRVARGVALVSALLVVVVELPLVAWALWGRSLPPVETLRSHRVREMG
jgi:hypothetical protein